jgi:DNA-binding GntR family transcriptional regulator
MAIEHFQLIKKPDRKATLADQVYETLHHAVIQGQLGPDTRLNQTELAERLDVSERTVREALARLVSEGLVRREPYREFRVVGLSPEDIEEIFHMRALLEGWAMELAAFEISQDELDRMRELLLKMEANTRPESIQTLQGTNRQFHWIAINACRKRHLIQVLKRLWDLMLPYSFAGEGVERLIQQARRSHIAHRQLVEALQARNGKAARTILARHSGDTMQEVRMQVKRLNRQKARENGHLVLQRLLPIRTSLEEGEYTGLSKREGSR